MPTATEYLNHVGEKTQQLLARSASDMEFRRKLLTDPRAAIAEFTGRDLSEVPESPKVVFIENKADATFVLPDPVDSAAELSEAELEAVAGGVTPVIASILSIIASIGKIYTD
jgi:hypothetical protein